MTLNELIHQTRLFTRDTFSNVFLEADIVTFINQGISRVRQYKPFRTMPYLSAKGESPVILPEPYHYLLPLFAAARLFDMDERFSEGTEKRNEFEYYFADLIGEIQAGNVELTDGTGTAIDDTTNVIDYVTDTYFGGTTEEE
jgi:hypothetical protein